MSFEQDLFISYAHLDDQTRTDEEKGWVTRFHRALEVELSETIGQEVSIWRDADLQANDVFSDEIADQLAKTAVLVSVLSPRYVKSDWCQKEVATFCQSAEQTGGMRVENKTRIFKVKMRPVPSEDTLPALLKDLIGLDFFTDKDGTPKPLDKAYGPEFGQEYRRKIATLAQQIGELLERLASDSGTVESSPPAKATVYLAECSRDRRTEREKLGDDLRRHGYEVLPDRQLRNDEEEDYVEDVNALLERSELAIHLVGERRGTVPDGPSDESVVVLQNQLAAKRSQSHGMPRVIWLPEGTHSEQEQQQAFIDALHEDHEAQLGADLITGDLEELKTSIHTKLEKLSKPEPEPVEQAPAEDAQKLIYLICDEKDRKDIRPIRGFLKDQGFDVTRPAFGKGDSVDIREAHTRLLGSCDAVLVFYGGGDEAWKRKIDSDLKKMPGYREGRPLLARYTYIAGPTTDDKEELIEDHERDLIKKGSSNLIDGMEDFSEAAMTPFVQALSPGTSTA